MPLGSLDISFYRDDFMTNFAPEIHATHIPFDVDGKRIVLVDDVLYTGLTIRAALDAVMDSVVPRSFSSPSWSTEAIASFLFAPTTWAKTSRLPATRTCVFSSKRWTARRRLRFWT